MERRCRGHWFLVTWALLTSSVPSAFATPVEDADRSPAVPPLDAGLDARVEPPDVGPGRETDPNGDAAPGQPAKPAEPVAASSIEPQVSNSIIVRMAENPLAGIFRIPAVSQTSFGIGPNDQVSHALTLAPIIPVVFPNGWGLLNRVAVPLVTAPDVAAGSGSTTGLGDTTLEVLGHKMLKGGDGSSFDIVAGPAFGFPSATDDALGTGKWLVGPEVGGAASVGMFVGGLLVRNLTSFAGDAGRASSNRLFLESFFFFNLPRLWYVVSEPLLVANWENSEGNRWTVPLGGGLGKTFLLPDLPWLGLTLRAQAFYNVVRPDNPAAGEIAPVWNLRFNLVFFNPNPLVFDW